MKISAQWKQYINGVISLKRLLMKNEGDEGGVLGD